MAVISKAFRFVFIQKMSIPNLENKNNPFQFQMINAFFSMLGLVVVNSVIDINLINLFEFTLFSIFTIILNYLAFFIQQSNQFN